MQLDNPTRQDLMDSPRIDRSEIKNGMILRTLIDYEGLVAGDIVRVTRGNDRRLITVKLLTGASDVTYTGFWWRFGKL